jgi:kynurenine formamidase
LKNLPSGEVNRDRTVRFSGSGTASFRPIYPQQRTEGIDITPGTVVLIRTGTPQYWGENGSDHEKIGEHDSVGIGVQAAKWLVEDKGAMMIGSDTSDLEYVPLSKDDSQVVGGSSGQSGTCLSAGRAGRAHPGVPQ